MATPPKQPAPKPMPPDATQGDWDDDEGENWRHAPVAPKDANPLDSLGHAVTDSVTGSEADKTPGPKT